MMLKSFRQPVVYVLVAYLTVVLAGAEQMTGGDAVKHDNSNAVVQQTTDLTGLRKYRISV